MSGLRGDQVLVETRLAARRAEWRRSSPPPTSSSPTSWTRRGAARRAEAPAELRLLGERDLAGVRAAVPARPAIRLAGGTPDP